jgi:Uma2 family endonuclease
MATVLSLPEGQVVLYDVSWSHYEQLLAEDTEARRRRMTYDRGTLEIMAPLYEHEECSRLIVSLLTVVALEWGIECRAAGSTTFKREDLEKGFEPDECFYIQNAGRIVGKKRLDLPADPPPDLIIEIEITRSVIDKLALFAAMGVPEVWRSDGTRIQVLHRVGGSFIEQERSVAFPPLTSEQLTRFLEASGQMSRTAWLQSVRDWARAQRETGDDAPVP